MANSRSLQQAVRFALAMTTAAAGVSGVQAQEAQPAQAAPATPALQEVVVTGSRLRTPNETSISPITTVSAKDVEATGLTRVEDVLNNLPMVFAGMNSTTSNGADGTATVDLRGLGNQRTLVLVNGLRLGPGSAAGGRNFADLNEIPAALISRVDVLTGGASAVYGADAVAGVVNFVLNTHFEGVQINAGYHFNQHNNNDQDGVAQYVTANAYPLPDSSVNTAFGKSVSVLMGSNFADNKGNATAYVTYDNQGAALQSKFDYSSCTLGPNAAYTKIRCGGSGTSAKNGAGGRFYATGTTGPLKNSSFINHTVDGTTGLFRPFSTPGDLFNFGPLNYYQTPNERWTAGGFVNYDVNSHVNVYASVMYMRNDSKAQIAPSGDFGVASFTPCADPLLTAQEVATLCTPAQLASQGNPFEIYNGVNYPGLNMYILRRNVEGGNRVATFLTNNARQVVGVKGDFTDAWTYNVYAQHSNVDTIFGNLNYLSNAAIEQSLNVLPGPGGTPVCGGPSNGLGAGPLVATTAAGGTAFSPTSGCVPWNIWVPHGVTPAALNFISIPEQAQGTVTEYVADGSITGDLGKYGLILPTADQGLQINVGAEWREDYSDFEPDYVSQQGLAAGGGGATPVTLGGLTVSEAFTELRLPIATQKPFAEDLSAEAGYRYSKYNLGFDTNTYKIGLEWAPVRDLRVRGSFQRAVRAPNIGELYTPQAVGLDGAHDPCAAGLAAGSTTVLTNGTTLAQCMLTGVTASEFGHIASNPAFQYNGLLSGTSTLKPETADSYTVGIVLQPRVLPSLTVSVDYFNIKIDNIIGPIGADAILNACLTFDLLCNKVHRDSNGSLWKTPGGYVIDPNVNQGSKKTEGVDLKTSYRQNLAGFGSALFSLEGTYLKNLITQPLSGGPSYDCTALFGTTCGGGNPEWRHVFNATWSTPWDGLDVTLRWRYFGKDSSEAASSNLFLQASNYAPLTNIDAFNYIDLSATFNLYKSVRLQVGVNNLFDKAPPIVVGVNCSTSSPAGANCNGNTFPGFYDALGRYLFVTLSAQF